MSSKQESEKKELSLGINTFDSPTELTGVDAWVAQVSKLLFMVPGTMPTDPGMGVNVQQYEFGFIDDVKKEIEEKVMSQVHTYLPDVPLTSVQCSNQTTSGGRVVFVCVLTFDVQNDERIAVVAAEESNNVINFNTSIG